MRRPFILRACLLAVLVVPALVFLGVGVDSQVLGQYRVEKYWKCSRCGGYLGNGVAPPPTCHHCNAKAKAANKASGSGSSKDAPPTVTFIVVGLGILAAGGLAFFLLTSKPKTDTRPPAPVY